MSELLQYYRQNILYLWQRNQTKKTYQPCISEGLYIDVFIVLSLLSISTSEQANNHLFNSAVCHGLCPADTFAFHFKWNSFVGSNTLVIGMKIRLDLLPHLLLGIKFLLRISCLKTTNKTNSTQYRRQSKSSIYAHVHKYAFVKAHIVSLYKLLREKKITCESQNGNFNLNQGLSRKCLQILSENAGLSGKKA